MKKITSKIYYRIEFVLASPLMLGSAQNERTDKDLLVDACRQPVIPGSALAGIYRSRLAMNEKEQRIYFGHVPNYDERKKKEEEPDKKEDGSKEEKDEPDNKADKSVENVSSRIIVYDARLKAGEPYITRRDFVALDEYKAAKQGSKFDAEVLEPGVTFVTYIEQNYCEGDRDVAEDIAKLWHGNRIVIGAKTMRGFGAVKDVKIDRAKFKLSNKESVIKWLKFDMFSLKGWTKYEPADIEAGGKIFSIKLTLKLQGAISIRRYTTAVSQDKKKAPDQEQLTVTDSAENETYAVIPGSTWAGAFRSHMKKLSPELDMDYFGYVLEKEKKKSKSRIRFSESKIDGGMDKVLSRNAIDRFTGGTVDKALFTEKVHYGGVTDLEIGFDNTIKEEMLLSLAAALTDLHYGFLSVGGETSIGHGLFQILKIDDRDDIKGLASEAESDGQKLYENIVQILKEKIKAEG